MLARANDGLSNPGRRWRADLTGVELKSNVAAEKLLGDGAVVDAEADLGTMGLHHDECFHGGSLRSLG